MTRLRRPPSDGSRLHRPAVRESAPPLALGYPDYGYGLLYPHLPSSPWGWNGSPFPFGRAPDRTHEHGYAPGGVLSEDQWRDAVARSRWLCDHNLFAAGFLDRLVDFGVGDGFGVEVILRGHATGAVATGVADANADGLPDPDPAVVECQRVWDEWCDYQDWGRGESDREAECFRRWRRDGESVLEWFAGGRSAEYLPAVRHVDPELIRTPTDDPSAKYGLDRDPDDAETVLRYWLAEPPSPQRPTDPTRGRWVEADRLSVLRANVDRVVPRGLPDFYATHELLTDAHRLLTNLGQVAGTQAAINHVREHAPGVTGEAVNRMISAGQTFEGLKLSPAGTTTEAVRVYSPNTVLDISSGMKFTPGPTANSEPLIAVLQAMLRGAGAQWGIPEFFSGDASNNNYASILVAGGPFERAMKRRQRAFAGFVRAVVRKVLALAAEAGRLPAEYVRRTDVLVTPPEVAIANRKEDEEIRQMRNQAGVLSVQTWQQQVGLDPSVEAANVKARQAQFPDPAQGGPAGGRPEGGGDDGDPFGESRGFL